jgi:epoxyqueuosine reductase QueG
MVMVNNGTAEILKVAEIDKVGVVRLDDWPDTPLYEQSRKLLPGAKSVVVLALEVLPEVTRYLAPERKVGEMAMRDLYDRSLEMVNGQLDWESYKLVKRLHGSGYWGLPLTAAGAPYDSRFIAPVLSYGDAAALAGLGTRGWHSMLLTPEFGGRIRLACVVADAPLPPTQSTEKYDPCPECGGACVKVCPVSAINPPQGEESGGVDKFACSNYLAAAGGCAQCLKVCPAGKSG